MAAFEQGRYWGGMYFLNSKQRPGVFAWFEGLGNNPDPYAHVILSYSWVPVIGVVSTSNVQYTKSGVTNPPLFDVLRRNALPIIGDTTRVSTTSDFADEIQGTNDKTARQLFTTFSFQNNAKFMETVYQISERAHSGVKSVSGLIWSISFQPITPQEIQAGKRSGGNVLGLDNSGPITVVLLTCSWDRTNDDANVRRVAEEMIAQATQAARAASLSSSYTYLNYAADFQDPISGYGGASEEFLRSVSRKYDSTQLFQSALRGGFKL